jgi:hypothetical protein
MINRTPTSEHASSLAAPSNNFTARCRCVSGFFLLLVVLALWVNTSRAAVTFTNFPAAVSNTYNGIITLQMNGLPTGAASVVVQKFLDVNTNGIIDPGDLLVQQFQLVEGQASTFMNGSTVVTVTNFLPGDMLTSTTGQITAPLNFQNGDFMQNLSGQYIYRVSSPAGAFTPATSVFNVTNMPFTSAVTGFVANASTGTVISNAVVLLFSTQNGGSYVQAGTVAGTNGFFIIHAPPGGYYLAAAKSNYFANLSLQPSFSINAGATNGQNTWLTSATTNIIGRITNMLSSTAVPGVSGLGVSTNDYLSLFISDTNGNYTIPVTNSAWTAEMDGFAAAFAGYLTPQINPFSSVSNSLVNITNTLVPEMAIFYGVVTNNSGSPVPGVYLYGSDTAGHQSWALTDKNGNYVLGAESNAWQFGILNPNNPGLNTNFVFSPGVQASVTNGQALQQNFGVNPAPYTITGKVQTYGGGAIAGAQVFATGTNAAGAAYQVFTATTAADGSYLLNISPGYWTVGLNSNSLASLGYTNIPPTQSTNLLTGGSAVINFSVVVCSEVAILTTNLPNAMVGSYYDTTLLGSSCQNTINWSNAYGVTVTGLFDQTNVTYPPGTPIYFNSQLVGYIETWFSFGVANNVQYVSNMVAGSMFVNDNAWQFKNLSAAVTVSGPITNTMSFQFLSRPSDNWTIGRTTNNGATYSTAVTLGSYSMSPQGAHTYNFYTITNGTLMTNTAAVVSNTVATLAGNFSSLATGNAMNIASTIPFNTTNSIVVWIGTNQGQYLISSYGPQAGGLPNGLTLYPNGTIAGTPTGPITNATYNFTVDAVDSAGNAAVQPLSLLVYPTTTISLPTIPLRGTNNTVLASNLFNLQVSGTLVGSNYTVWMATNLPSTNWTPIFATRPNSNSFNVTDANATNRERFYLIQMGP